MDRIKKRYDYILSLSIEDINVEINLEIQDYYDGKERVVLNHSCNF